MTVERSGFGVTVRTSPAVFFNPRVLAMRKTFRSTAARCCCCGAGKKGRPENFLFCVFWCSVGSGVRFRFIFIFFATNFRSHRQRRKRTTPLCLFFFSYGTGTRELGRDCPARPTSDNRKCDKKKAAKEMAVSLPTHRKLCAKPSRYKRAKYPPFKA